MSTAEEQIKAWVLEDINSIAEEVDALAMRALALWHMYGRFELNPSADHHLAYSNLHNVQRLLIIVNDTLRHTRAQMVWNFPEFSKHEAANAELIAKTIKWEEEGAK